MLLFLFWDRLVLNASPTPCFTFSQWRWRLPRADNKLQLVEPIFNWSDYWRCDWVKRLKSDCENSQQSTFFFLCFSLIENNSSLFILYYYYYWLSFSCYINNSVFVNFLMIFFSLHFFSLPFYFSIVYYWLKAEEIFALRNNGKYCFT